jgi:hypothetical protein
VITISAFRWVPPFAQGLVRDLRVRWALEEAGLPYRARLKGYQERCEARPAFRKALADQMAPFEAARVPSSSPTPDQFA